MDLTIFDKVIRKEDIIDKVSPGDFIILKTRKKADYFRSEMRVYLEDNCFKYLIDMNIKGLGIDSFQIEDKYGDSGNHRMLLKNKIPVISSLNLENIKEGKYFLIALPLKLTGAEASPTRAILIEDFLKK